MLRTGSFPYVAGAILAGVVAVAATAADCDGMGAPPQADAAAGGAPAALVDRPLEAFRRELLQTAFAVASSIPAEPHVKDRSRAQEAAVAACLRLDQPALARQYISRIENWRRGVAYADLAIYAARQGAIGEVQDCLILANACLPSAEEWRGDRIRVKVAEAHVLLGQLLSAAELVRSADPIESAKLARAHAMTADAEQFDAHMSAMEPVLATRGFDQVRTALEACAELHDRLYDDKARRSRAEERIRGAWGPLPAPVRVELLLTMAGNAIGHDDAAAARAFADDAEHILNGSNWLPEDRIETLSEIAAVRARAGDRDGARRGADAAMELYGVDRERIAGMFRAQPLRAIAVAYQAIGDGTRASETYALALEEGAENPNARPRALDLSATCVSMAEASFEPSKDLWDRIARIRGGLVPPW